MARQEIPMVINLRQNKNSSSNGYGKWYPEADSKEPLTIRRGLICSYASGTTCG